MNPEEMQSINGMQIPQLEELLGKITTLINAQSSALDETSYESDDGSNYGIDLLNKYVSPQLIEMKTKREYIGKVLENKKQEQIIMDLDPNIREFILSSKNEYDKDILAKKETIARLRGRLESQVTQFSQERNAYDQVVESLEQLTSELMSIIEEQELIMKKQKNINEQNIQEKFNQQKNILDEIKHIKSYRKNIDKQNVYYKQYNQAQKILDWFFHSQTSFSRLARSNQTKMLIETADAILLNKEINNRYGTFQQLILHIAFKLELGITKDQLAEFSSSSSTSTSSLPPNDTIKIELLTKYFIILGNLINIKEQINKEIKVSPSRLVLKINEHLGKIFYAIAGLACFPINSDEEMLEKSKAAFKLYKEETMPPTHRKKYTPMKLGTRRIL